MSSLSPIVYVIDDTASVRTALDSLIRSVGLEVKIFSTPREFLGWQRSEAPGCLILDVRLPGMSGLEVQRELAEAKVRIPIIFVTGHGDIRMSVQAMKAGAVEFLTKPFREQDLLDAIQIAVDRDRVRRRREVEIEALRKRLETLTLREREVLPLIVAGLPNKEIATAIGARVTTVKVHRSQLMRKMIAASVADLVRMAEKMNLEMPPDYNDHDLDADLTMVKSRFTIEQ